MAESGGGFHRDVRTFAAPAVLLGERQQARRQRALERRRRHIGQRLGEIATVETHIGAEIRPVVAELIENELFECRRLFESVGTDPIDAFKAQQIGQDGGNVAQS
jgi:hypothetical protein